MIDEVSMLDASRLDLLNDLAKLIRKNDDPMGGIQVILVGDLFQLPPANTDFKGYVFNSLTWKELDIKTCYLNEQHRQNDGDELNSILQAIRYNRLKDSELQLLQSKIDDNLPYRKNIMRLYSHNFDADQVNKQHLDSLKHHREGLQNTI